MRRCSCWLCWASSTRAAHFGQKTWVSTQPGPTSRAREPHPSFKVLYGDSAPDKVHILHPEGKGLRHPAPQAEQEADEEPVPQIAGSSYQLLNLFRVQVSLGLWDGIPTLHRGMPSRRREPPKVDSSVKSPG